MATQNECNNCGNKYKIEDEDLKFYERASPVIGGKKHEIPPPTHCPACRQQRRLIIRNDMKLYKRTCDFTKKNIVSMYSPDKKLTVYDQDIWWSDKWDPMKYGKNYDLSRSFFEQFKELSETVPRMSLNCIANENSYFTNYALRNRNCYLIYTADNSEDCYYGRFADRNSDCCDYDFTTDSECCYGVIDIQKSQRLFYSQKCFNCSDLYFCYDMRGCNDCMFSTGLRNKRHHVFNEKVSREEYDKLKKELNSYRNVQENLKKAHEFFMDKPRKYLEVINCENSLGDYLKDSKNANYCFDCYDLEDVKFASHLFGAKDCYDWDFVGGKSELCYEMASSAHDLFNCLFSMNCWDGNSNLMYCDLCLGNKDLFGCIGLRKKQYCILNKQYTKEEYEELVPKIIERMREDGEWGEFFPMNLSSYAYNESVVNEWYPLSREEVLKKGLKWKEKDSQDYLHSDYEIPDDIKDVPDNIVEEILACEDCKKNYRIIKEELRFYKRFKIPIPHKCPECRHASRRILRNPRSLYKRKCSDCSDEMMTTYSPGRKEPVYCEKCYKEAIY